MRILCVAYDSASNAAEGVIAVKSYTANNIISNYFNTPMASFGAKIVAICANW